MSDTESKRAAELRAILTAAAHDYYVRDRPTLADAEYDKLFRELQGVEARRPDLRTPDSPTLRVGADVPDGHLAKCTHLVPMTSLDNAFSDEELAAWDERAARLVGEAVHESGYTVELKIDGAAVSLTYRDGLLERGATRGNGTVGEDVTANLRTIHEIPLRLTGTRHPPLIEIRGEVYMTFEGFERMNEERVRDGEPVFANPRNSAAGALRQKDPAATAKRPLRFFGYAFAVPDRAPLPFRTQWELLETLASWGIAIAPHRQRCLTLADVHRWAHDVEATVRATLNFGIDGGVVKVDSLALQAELGMVSGRVPRWAVARKFAPDIAETRLLAIKVNVGRTGKLNPWAELEPVEIGGVIVRNATLHNAALIASKDLREGDWVQVKRAGEVIPQVIGPIPERRTGQESPWTAPETCPECGTPVERVDGEVDTYCPNAACPGRRLEALIHFTSRAAMDIRGLSEARLVQFVDAGVVDDAAALYDLTPKQIAALDGFAAKSAEQLVAAIAASKQQPLSRLLFALGIRHVGEGAAELLARQFGTLDALAAARLDAIEGVRGIGPAIAESVHAWFRDPWSTRLVEKLRRHALGFDEPQRARADGALQGLTVVLTGALPTLSRAQATQLVEQSGGRVTDSVSKKTSLLVAGDDAGSKLEKAKALGVEVIDERELLRRVGRAP